MTATQTAGEFSPALIFDTLNRYQHSMALRGAVDLGLFTEIATGASTAAELAKRCDATERGIRILCDFLTVIGFVTKTDDKYTLTPESAVFLDARSPAYMGTVAQFLTHPRKLGFFHDVAALVRKGGTLDGVGSLDPDGQIWVEFAERMVPMILFAARITASIVSEPGRTQKVLDIAAGHGMFGIQIALTNPNAEIFALDLEPVLPVAIRNAAKAGVGNRVHPIAGSAFETDLGSGYDLVLIPNLLHHFDADQNVRLLKRVHGALKPGGRVATVEFVPNDDRVSPPVPATFSLMMLAYTATGEAFTFRELDGMFRKAGFGESSQRPLSPTPQTLILTER